MMLPSVGKGLRPDTAPVPATRFGNNLTKNVLKEYLRMLSSLFSVISDLLGAILTSYDGSGNLVPIILNKKVQLCKTSLNSPVIPAIVRF